MRKSTSNIRNTNYYSRVAKTSISYFNSLIDNNFNWGDRLNENYSNSFRSSLGRIANIDVLGSFLSVKDNNWKLCTEDTDWKLGAEVNDWKLGAEVNDWKLGAEVNDWKLGTEVNDWKCTIFDLCKEKLDKEHWKEVFHYDNEIKNLLYRVSDFEIIGSTEAQDGLDYQIKKLSQNFSFTHDPRILLTIKNLKDQLKVLTILRFFRLVTRTTGKILRLINYKYVPNIRLGFRKIIRFFFKNLDDTDEYLQIILFASLKRKFICKYLILYTHENYKLHYRS